MYYPFFRGKQYDLLAIKESASVIKTASFRPIIEPVKESFSSLTRCLQSLDSEGAEAILIVNPRYGDHKGNWQQLADYFATELAEFGYTFPGILLLEDSSLAEVSDLIDHYGKENLFFVHSGFSKAKALTEWLAESDIEATHIFVEDFSVKTYRRYFKDFPRVLVRDGFEKRTNSKHPELEMFSDLHLTFQDEGMEGFGDFLTVGDDYSESGGPAYAVAIHITFIDTENDDIMFIHHFKSIRQDTPQDPAGKFLEALEKLVAEVNSPDSQILRTSAIEEFLKLYENQHFPGLGYVKKLSMIHHLETLADFLASDAL
ncbi:MULTISPECIES: sce7725 family protein [Marinobacter]|uniref:sce7725 family protein n=1 Tax=Marinobacter TaxID=2742 RepID=UPI001247714B|nr:MULTISPECIES: sce7725 family protein [Marinobacter]MBL3556871.1 sce7725 family protein [Marinobacter sp. JB05H06]